MSVADLVQIAHEKGLEFIIGPSGWAPDSEINIRINQGDRHLLKVVNYDNLKKAVDPDVFLWTLLQCSIKEICDEHNQTDGLL